MPEGTRFDNSWLVRRDGTPVAITDGGAVELLAELRLTRPLGRIIRALHASAFVDASVRLVSRSRGRIGRFAPDGPAPRRYP